MSSTIKVQSEFVLFPAQAVSSDINTDGVRLDIREGYSIQAVWSGGSGFTGIFTLEASNDNVNFAPIPGSGVFVNGVTGNHIYDVGDFHYRFGRVSLDVTAGSVSNMEIKVVVRSRE
jgi:hypothetical protein